MRESHRTSTTPKLEKQKDEYRDSESEQNPPNRNLYWNQQNLNYNWRIAVGLVWTSLRDKKLPGRANHRRALTLLWVLPPGVGTGTINVREKYSYASANGRGKKTTEVFQCTLFLTKSVFKKTSLAETILLESY